MLVAALAAAAVLVLPDPRRRAIAMPVALLASAVAIATLVGERLGENVGRHPVAAAVAAALGLVAVGAVAFALVRRPHLLALLALAVLAFRVPVPVGDGSANLLVPLYVVIAGGCLAFLVRLRRDPPAAEEPRWPPLVMVERALALFVVVYALQAMYSSDLATAAKNVAFFYAPFAVLFRLAADVRWSAQMLRTALWVVAGLSVAFASVAFVEYATGHLLIPNPKVLAANEAKEYFRVNSLFFDPNIYGRYVALSMVALAAVLLWSRRTRTTALAAAALAVLWAGLVLSLSQSSFATLLAALAVLAAIRWRTVVVLGACALALGAGAALVLVSPGTFGLEETTDRALNRATSGRAKLVEAGIDMARERPVWGFGSGSFADRYRERERVFSPTAAAESHTTPLTVAAEQGAIGLLTYVLLLGATLRLAFARMRAALRGRVVVATARAAVAAAYCGMVVHTFGYAAFLEDPLTWTLLALAASLSRFEPTERDVDSADPAV